jgi:hypothetical protein
MKNPFASKVLWLNVLVGAAAALMPAVKELVSDHPGLMANILAVANVLLRVFSTTEPIGFEPGVESVKPRYEDLTR